ncbi:unnamed protein product [Camellia sinensis]
MNGMNFSYYNVQMTLFYRGESVTKGPKVAERRNRKACTKETTLLKLVGILQLIYICTNI